MNTATGNEANPDLDALYAAPAERIQKAVLDRLVDVHIDYLKVARFFCLATGSEQGLDASPRGGPAGFVNVLDAQHVAFADWPGNNRIESLRNLTRDNRVGMVFLFPGLDIFLRINGHGRISTDPALLTMLDEGKRAPKSAVVVEVKEVLLHCGKALNRAQLWESDAHIAHGSLPTAGAIIASFTKLDATQPEITAGDIAQIDAHYDHAVRHDLY